VRKRSQSLARMSTHTRLLATNAEHFEASA
jgi:hypothetical protein